MFIESKFLVPVCEEEHHWRASISFFINLHAPVILAAHLPDILPFIFLFLLPLLPPTPTHSLTLLSFYCPLLYPLSPHSSASYLHVLLSTAPSLILCNFWSLRLFLFASPSLSPSLSFALQPPSFSVPQPLPPPSCLSLDPIQDRRPSWVMSSLQERSIISPCHPQKGYA